MPWTASPQIHEIVEPYCFRVSFLSPPPRDSLSECSGVKTWWAEDKLSNYRCCRGNMAVFSSPRCNNQEVGTWSGWSSWGGCEKEVGAGRVEQRQRRFKVAVGTTSTWKQVEQEMEQEVKEEEEEEEEEECLWVAREGRTCGEGESLPRGGCSIPDVVDSVPVC